MSEKQVFSEARKQENERVALLSVVQLIAKSSALYAMARGLPSPDTGKIVNALSTEARTSRHSLTAFLARRELVLQMDYDLVFELADFLAKDGIYDGVFS